MQSHQALGREWEVGNGQWIDNTQVTVGNGSELWLLAAQIGRGDPIVIAWRIGCD